MIPNGSTPIKNEILTEIFAKGLLDKEEIRIVAYIIRWSWGFVGQNRRQNWTKPLQQVKIAEDIDMSKSNLNANLKKMIAEKKIFKKNNCYQFNEHYENWVKVIEKITESYLIDNQSYLIDNQSYLKDNSKSPKANDDNGLRERKETIKETIKETNNIINKRDINNIIADQAFQGVENITVKQFKKYNSIFYSIDENQWYIDTDIYDKWVAIFSDFDIDVELKEMGRWLEKRPERYRALTTKGNYAVWCCNWFYRKRKWAKENNKSVEEIRSEGADDFSKAFAENNFKM